MITGKRDDPFTVMSTLVTRLDSSESPETEVRMMADTIRSTFRLPYVHVQIRQPQGGVTASSSGIDPGHTERYPLVYQGEYIGRVCLGATNGPVLSTRDRQLLETLIRQSAAALYASMAADELQRIREQLVTAREEERHRIHRDLHDGLGPTMAGIVLRLETARKLVLTDQHRALAALDAGVQEARGTVQEIRRLVHGLRPPSLDDVGLERALERQCALLSAGPGTTGTVISFTAERVKELPSAVEVAAYRIVLEALNNVIRHAHARACDVKLRTIPEDDVLEITVLDDGVGIGPNALEGSGLRSQRDRAAELGGSAVVSTTPSGGTLVRILLPLQPRDAREQRPALTRPNSEESR
jgi:signal transduction histidine kinase